jgi:hypothetical protein
MKFKSMLRRYAEAVKQRAFKGSMEPESWREVDEEHDAAKRALVEYVENLEASRDEAAEQADA